AVAGNAGCVCERGYRATGLNCLPEAAPDPCDGVTCSGHGRCAVTGGAPGCACDAGYRPSGLECVPSAMPDPCAGVPCSAHGRCLVADGAAVCHCDAGYASRIVPTNCQPAMGTVCEGVACGAGTCLIRIVGGAFAECACDPGYASYASACVPERRLFCRDAAG